MKRPHPKNTFGGIPRFIGKTNRHPTPKVTQPEASTLAEVRGYCDEEGIEHFHIPGWLLETFGKLFLLVTVVLEKAWKLAAVQCACLELIVSGKQQPNPEAFTYEKQLRAQEKAAAICRQALDQTTQPGATP